MRAYRPQLVYQFSCPNYGGHDDDRAVELHQPEEKLGMIINQGSEINSTDRPALLLEYLRKKKLTTK